MFSFRGQGDNRKLFLDPTTGQPTFSFGEGSHLHG